MNTQLIQWILRITIAGEFVGHGVFALQGKAQWVVWIENMLHMGAPAATQLLFVIGLSDLLVALIVLLRPIRVVLLWAALWGFWTALVRPLIGEPIWDFIERWANWGAPLALLMMRGGFPKTMKEWFK